MFRCHELYDFLLISTPVHICKYSGPVNKPEIPFPTIKFKLKLLLSSTNYHIILLDNYESQFFSVYYFRYAI